MTVFCGTGTLRALSFPFLRTVTALVLPLALTSLLTQALVKISDFFFNPLEIPAFLMVGKIGHKVIHIY